MKKLNRCKSLRKYAYKKASSHVDCSARTISIKKNGKKSERTEGCLSITRIRTSSTEVTSPNDLEAEEQRINKYADTVAKTENIWSENNLVLKEDKLNLVSQCSIVNSSFLDKNTYPPQEKQNVEVGSTKKKAEDEEIFLFCESTLSKNFTLSLNCDIQNSASNLVKIKSSVPETQSIKGGISTSLMEGNSKTKNLAPFEEYISGKSNHIHQMLDEDSAYGSGESVLGYSPEPKDIETDAFVTGYDDLIDQSPDRIKYDAGSKMNKKSTIYPKYSDQDSECIFKDSECGTSKPGEFQEFLNGVDHAKPRIVLQAKKICEICHKEVVDEFFLSNRFGLLLNCNHSFCYHCIYSSCYQSKIVFSLFKVNCPVCGAFSPGIVSSSRWIQSKIKKANLFRDLQASFIEWKVLKSSFTKVSSKLQDHEITARA